MSRAALMALVAAGFAAAATCSSQEQADRNAGAGGISGAGGAGTVFIDAGGPQTDPAMTPPSDVVFPDPPLISCDDSASDGGGCGFVQAVCEIPACDDAGACNQSLWLRAYGNPRCVSGRCVWDPSYYWCGERCVNGGCHYNGTTIP